MITKINIEEVKSIGTDCDKGNILGIQPFMNPQDYDSGDNFTSALDDYLLEAKSQGFLNSKTVVVFPEHIGTWLLFADVEPGFTKAPTIDELIQRLIKKSPEDFQKCLSVSKEKDNILASVFRMRSDSIATLYQKTFSHLASKYKVFVVAGSVTLSNPSVENGSLSSRKGPIYNTSAVFNPDGTLYPHLTKKVYPVPAEIGFITPSSVEEISPIDLPCGKVGVLVCGDSWYTDPYIKIKDANVDFIVVPSYQNEMGLWDEPWKGYPDYASERYDKSDLGKITEGQAWEKYALKGKIHNTKAKVGLNVFMKGNLWNMGADSGHSMAVRGPDYVEISTPRAGLVNVWLS